MKKGLLFITTMFIALQLNAQSLITNYDFEDGQNGWSKKGANGPFTVEDDGTGNNVGKMINSTSGAIKDVSLKPDAVSAFNYYSYHYSVSVKATEAIAGETPTFMFKTQVLNDGLSAGYTDGFTYDLTTDWNTYECYFEKTNANWDELRPYFQMGAIAGDYYFDNYIVEVNRNVPNGDFEFGNIAKTWILKQDNGSIEASSDANGGSNSLKANVTTAGAAYRVSSRSLLVAVDENTTYNLSFFAKSDAGNGKIKLSFEYHNTDTIIKTDFISNVQPGTNYEEIVKGFTAPAGAKSVRIGFLMAEVEDVLYLDDIRIEKDDATAIKENVDETVKVFPNPAKDVVNIQGSSVIKSVEVSDLSGRTVMSQNEVNGKMDVSSLKRGVYLVRVTTADGIKVVKFVKE
jgi:hypothetical protein